MRPNRVLRNMAVNPVSAKLVNPFHDAIDFSTDAGKKFFIQATKGLDEKEKHDGDSKKILRFLRKIEEEGENNGFASIGQNIPKGDTTVNFFENPGEVSKEEIKQCCDGFWTCDSDDDKVQKSIKSNVFFHCVSKSMTSNVSTEIQSHAADWKRPGGGDGPMLLCHVLKFNSHGTRASARICEKKLSTVETKDFGHDVLEANKWFDLQHNETSIAGEKNHDRAWHLFNCCLTCPVAPFKAAIEREKRSAMKEKQSILKNSN